MEYSALQSQAFTFNPFQENTFLLYSASGDCIILDPGCYEPEEKEELKRFINKNGLTPTAVWLTHTHIDHVLGLRFCVETWQIPFWIHHLEIPQLNAVEVYASNYGFYDYRSAEGVRLFDMENELVMGGEQFRILFVPGHAPGHVAFYHKKSAQVWAGDVLFRQSIGRTDLPGGNFDQLEKSIQNQLYTLPAETVVFPGHGPSTTIGFEKKNNPFVKL